MCSMHAIGRAPNMHYARAYTQLAFFHGHRSCKAARKDHPCSWHRSKDRSGQTCNLLAPKQTESALWEVHCHHCKGFVPTWLWLNSVHTAWYVVHLRLQGCVGRSTAPHLLPATQASTRFARSHPPGVKHTHPSGLSLQMSTSQSDRDRHVHQPKGQ